MYTANQFVKLLSLKDSNLNSINLSRIIENVYAFAEEIWKSPQLYNFVDHGIDHSYNNCEKTLDLLKFLPAQFDLSPAERCIIGIASLLHDVGMQRNKFFPADILSNDEIRKKHTTLGYLLYTTALNQSEASKIGISHISCNPNDKWFLEFAAKVAFSHSGNEFLLPLLKETPWNSGSGDQLI